MDSDDQDIARGDCLLRGEASGGVDGSGGGAPKSCTLLTVEKQWLAELDDAALAQFKLFLWRQHEQNHGG
eukprot:SAG11_NODE_7700_length_1108_cov_1.477701_1_plen_69_part_10